MVISSAEIDFFNGFTSVCAVNKYMQEAVCLGCLPDGAGDDVMFSSRPPVPVCR